MPKISIFYKILKVIIGILILSTLLILIVSIWIETLRIEKSLLQENMKLAEIVSKSIEAGYFVHIWPLETLKQVGESENVLFWWLVKPDGEIYLANNPEFFGKIIDDPSIGTKNPVVKDSFFYKTKEKIKLIVYPVNIGEIKKPWTFYLGISEKPILVAQKKMFFTNIILFLMIIFFAGFLSFFLARTITNPIKALRNATAKIAKGEFVRAKVKSKDEIGELATSFNKMMEDLKKSHVALEETKTVLEIKVKARTRELKELAQTLEDKVKERTKKLKDSQKALMNMLEDIEEARQRAEAEKNKTLAIINNFTDGLLVFDDKNKLLLINPQAENLLKIKKAAVEGKSILEFSKTTPLGSLSKILGEKLKKVSRREFKLGGSLILEITIVPIMEEKEKLGNLVILHNISREKLVEKLKSEFVSLTAHQLRTPLSAIKWTIKMVLDEDLGKINEEQREFLGDAYKSNERMINLINSLLNISRIEEGRYIYKLSSIDIGEITKKVINFYKGEAKKIGLRIEFKKPKRELPKVKVDVEKIQIVIDNLLKNALKYTPKGGRVTISLKNGKKEIEFSIKDNGVGIPKNQQKRIFSKFFRATNIRKIDTTGSGLGLYITKNIINAHHGKIWFVSKEGKGTTFNFTIPIK